MEKLSRSEARKLYWSTIPKEERSQRARKLAIAKNKKMTKKEKSEHALMMLKARHNKK